MTVPPIHGAGGSVPPLRIPVLTAPVVTGVPLAVGDEPALLPQGAPPAAGAGVPAGTLRDDAPIALAGRLDTGDLLPDTTQLALALETATRALQNGRADQVLTALDAVWSAQLASDSPWYLRTAALQLLGRVDDAEQVLRDAIARLPRSAAMLYLLGVHTTARGQLEAARLASDHALSLHPTEPLLWLQRAALAQADGMEGTAAAMLEHVHGMEPGFPAAHWLSTLVRLGQATTRTSTPLVQRAVSRPTPSGVPALAERGDETAAPAPPPSGVLETAVRYGLTLLESPTQSARTATQMAAGDDTAQLWAERVARGPAPPVTPRAPMPSWDALVLAACVVVLVAVPSLRIPALMLSGALLMLMVSRTLR